MIAPVNIIEATASPEVWAHHFRDRATWLPWFTIVKALFGLPLDESELPLFTELTGRATPPTEPAKEGWLIVGRRGGKSRILALIAAYLAAFVDWSPYLVPGERGIITVIASDRKQCRSIMSYLRAFLIETELLSELVVKDTDEEIVLANGVVIEVVTCSFKAVRGRTVLACCADEAAFWASEDGSNPASEVIKALRPAMATVKPSLMLVASSPYARRGPLYDAWQRYWAKDSRVLVVKAPTWVLNPSLSRESEVIAEEYEKDPSNAAAEYGAEFRSDLESYVSKDVVDIAIVQGRLELPFITGQAYTGFYDAAGGSGGDSFTAAVAHLDRGVNRDAQRVILDATREHRPPFSPEGAIAQCATFFKSYGVRRVTADRYAGAFPTEIFNKYGITVVHSEDPKSAIYSEFLPLLNSQRVDLLDQPRLTKQLLSLERRTARGGKDSIDHPPGQHDDIINSAAGACVLAATKPPMVISAEAVMASRAPPDPYASMTFGQKPKCFF